eukprot:NODE_12225_length_1238_cov_1.672367.p1 GENE.NODE_12225_length_1238_cov_1.672367~~NODE_12225_length_1238_cov_1.672367.p1  ORF type:complete len:387 (-),score=65.23 NODE_12225_length_1238_cov_1.672367:78-1148(-)
MLPAPRRRASMPRLAVAVLGPGGMTAPVPSLGTSLVDVVTAASSPSGSMLGKHPSRASVPVQRGDTSLPVPLPGSVEAATRTTLPPSRGSSWSGTMFGGSAGASVATAAGAGPTVPTVPTPPLAMRPTTVAQQKVHPVLPSPVVLPSPQMVLPGPPTPPGSAPVRPLTPTRLPYRSTSLGSQPPRPSLSAVPQRVTRCPSTPIGGYLAAPPFAHLAAFGILPAGTHPYTAGARSCAAAAVPRGDSGSGGGFMPSRATVGGANLGRATSLGALPSSPAFSIGSGAVSPAILAPATRASGSSVFAFPPSFAASFGSIAPAATAAVPVFLPECAVAAATAAANSAASTPGKSRNARGLA